ncbi:hypothetical protein Hanom_Chr17g01591621 [Helianthus anomalus]
MTESSERAGGSWFTILNSKRSTPLLFDMLTADSWTFSITVFLRFSSMSRVSVCSQFIS